MSVTMKDISKRLGVSINAVSIALNNKAGVSQEMRSTILRTAEEMGYLDQKKRYMNTYSSNNLCIMMQKIYSIDMVFYSKVLFAVVEEAKQDDYDTIMNFFDDAAMTVPNCVKQGRVAGIVVIGKISDVNILELKKYKLPLVLADHASLLHRVDSILSDNKMGGYIITKYLLEKGFQQIGFLGDLAYSLSIKERFFGFREAISSYSDALQVGNTDDYIRKYSILSDVENAVLSNDTQTFVQLIKSAHSLPQAFVCSNDRAAISMLMALQTLNVSVPADISLVGFDNIDMCEKVNPKLTTVNVNKEELGRRAVQRLRYLINHPGSEPENIEIGVRLVERESVGTQNNGAAIFTEPGNLVRP